ncbi:MAG: DMT family transporter [Neisseria sp.]|nr:DMT family transporter [Neisseria sp.]
MSFHRLTSIALFVTPPLMWTGNVIVARFIRSDIPPMSLAFLRWLIACAVLLPFVWPAVHRQLPLFRANFPLVFGTALTGVAAFNSLLYTGLQSTGSTNALLLNSCAPVLIMLFAALMARQRLNAFQSAGLLVSLAGVSAIILQGSWQNLLALRFNQGDLWVFGAVLCWVFYTLWMRRIPAEIDRISLTAVQIALGMPLLLLPMLWELDGGVQIRWNMHSVLALAYVGLFPSVLAYLCYNAAISRFGSVRAGMSIHLMPVFGSILAVTLLGEAFRFYHLAGIAAIFAGIYLSNRKAV